MMVKVAVSFNFAYDRIILLFVFILLFHNYGNINCLFLLYFTYGMMTLLTRCSNFRCYSMMVLQTTTVLHTWWI